MKRKLIPKGTGITCEYFLNDNCTYEEVIKGGFDTFKLWRFCDTCRLYLYRKDKWFKEEDWAPIVSDGMEQERCNFGHLVRNPWQGHETECKTLVAPRTEGKAKDIGPYGYCVIVFQEGRTVESCWDCNLKCDKRRRLSKPRHGGDVPEACPLPPE